jgi:hypothetical protein
MEVQRFTHMLMNQYLQVLVELFSKQARKYVSAKPDLYALSNSIRPHSFHVEYL